MYNGSENIVWDSEPVITGTATNQGHSVTAEVLVSTGDYFELVVVQDSGSTLSIYTDVSVPKPFLAMELL